MYFTKKNTQGLLFLCLSILLLGCQSEVSKPSPNNPNAWHRIEFGGQKIEIQLAKTIEQQSKGLMHRKHLAPNQGMLFIFPTQDKRSFWMYNTLIPLDIGYFSADGTLLEIYPMYPHNRTGVPSRSNKIKYALEMNQGWFAKHKVRPGTKLDVEQF